MRRILFLLILFSFCLAARGVNKEQKIDSLKSLIEESTGERQLQLMNQLADVYHGVSGEKAYEISREVYQLAQELNNAEIIADALLNMARTFSYKGEYPIAINYYDTALQYYWEADDTIGQIVTMRYLGDNYYNRNRYADAFENYLKSLRLSEQINYLPGIFRLNLAIGNLYLTTGDEKNALSYYEYSLILAQQLEKQDFIAEAYQRLGIFYYKTGRFVEAIESLNKSLYLYTLLNDKKGLSNIYENIGDYYIQTGNYQIALSNYQKSLQHCIEAGCILPLGNIYTKMSHVYQLLGNYSKSLDYNRKALGARKEYGNTAQISSSYLNLGSNFILLQQYDSANKYLIRGINLAREINHDRYLRDGYYKLYNLMIKRENYEAAVDYLERYHNLKEKIISRERSKEIAELRAKYDLHDKQIEIELQNLQLDKKQNQFIIAIFATILFLALLLFIYFLYLNKKRTNNRITQINHDLENKFELKTRELRRQESQFQNLVEQIPMGVYRTLPTGKVEFANMALIRLLRYDSIEEMKTINLEKQNPAMQESRKRFKEIIELHGEVKNLESVWVRADGSMVNVSEYARAVYNDEGNILYYEGVVEDITIRKQAEEALKDALTSARESDRLKTAFLSTMQHELRTPLNSILGFSEILADNEKLDENSREYMSLINQSGHHLLDIINDILDITTITAGKIKLNYKNHNLNLILADIYQDIEQRRSQMPEKSGINIFMKAPLPDAAVKVKTDAKRLQQILNNLLDNALKFTTAGEINFGYEEAGDGKLRFFVRDTGIGIPKSKRSIIFEQFRQVEDTDTRQFGGSGLGLAISKSLVNLMGGEIMVESTPGKGSEFFFVLTFDEQDDVTRNGKNAKQHTVSINWQQKSLLIAEDNYANFYLIKTYLKKTGIKILHAKNGEEAIDKIKAEPAIDMVLMDIQLPGINGYVATERIKKIRPELPVVAVTAYTNDKDRQACLQAGCNDYIPKPINRKILFEKITQYIW